LSRCFELKDLPTFFLWRIINLCRSWSNFPCWIHVKICTNWVFMTILKGKYTKKIIWL
jgi:hypothetical protein